MGYELGEHDLTPNRAHLIIPTQTNQKQHSRDILKTMDPFPPFGFLPPHINKMQFGTLSRSEMCFGNGGCADATVDDVLICGLEGGGEDSVEVVEEAARTE